MAKKKNAGEKAAKKKKPTKLNGVDEKGRQFTTINGRRVYTEKDFEEAIKTILCD